MAFNNMQWNPLQSPNFDGVSRSNWTTANLLGNSLNGLNDALTNFRTAQEDRATANMMGAMQQYGTAEEAQAAMANGSAFLGINPNHISANGRSQAMGQVNALSGLDNDKLGRVNTQHGMDIRDQEMALKRQQESRLAAAHAQGASGRELQILKDQEALRAFKEQLAIGEETRFLDTEIRTAEDLSAMYQQNLDNGIAFNDPKQIAIRNKMPEDVRANLTPMNVTPLSDTELARQTEQGRLAEQEYALNIQNQVDQQLASAMKQEEAKQSVRNADRNSRSVKFAKDMQEMERQGYNSMDMNSAINPTAKYSKSLSAIIDRNFSGELKDQLKSKFNQGTLTNGDLVRAQKEIGKSYESKDLSVDQLREDITKNVMENSKYNPSSFVNDATPESNPYFTPSGAASDVLNSSVDAATKQFNNLAPYQVYLDPDNIDIDTSNEEELKKHLGLSVPQFQEIRRKVTKEYPTVDEKTLAQVLKKSSVDRWKINPWRLVDGNVDWDVATPMLRDLDKSGGYEKASLTQIELKNIKSDIAKFNEETQELYVEQERIKNNKAFKTKEDKEKALAANRAKINASLSNGKALEKRIRTLNSNKSNSDLVDEKLKKY